jgi:hypothetical protein
VVSTGGRIRPVRAGGRIRPVRARLRAWAGRARSRPGVFVGYDDHSKAWRLAVLRDGRWRILISRDVHFVEAKRGFVLLQQELGTRSQRQSYSGAADVPGEPPAPAAPLQPMDPPLHNPNDVDARDRADKPVETAHQPGDEAANLPAVDEAVHDADSSVYDTPQLDMSDAEDVPGNSPEKVVPDPVQETPPQWHVNSAQDIWDDAAMAGRPKRIRRVRFDEYVHKFVDNCDPVERPDRGAGVPAADAPIPQPDDATDDAVSQNDLLPNDRAMLDAPRAFPALPQAPQSTRLRSLQDIAGQLPCPGWARPCHRPLLPLKIGHDHHIGEMVGLQWRMRLRRCVSLQPRECSTACGMRHL